MSNYILYGIQSELITDVKMQIELILDICFEERDSTYQGGIYYLFGQTGAEQLLLKKNVDPFDGEPAEQDFAEYPLHEYPLLFYIHATERASELIAVVSKGTEFKLLRHEVL